MVPFCGRKQKTQEAEDSLVEEASSCTASCTGFGAKDDPGRARALPYACWCERAKFISAVQLSSRIQSFGGEGISDKVGLN